MDAPKAGQRLRCATCGTEIVVVKAPSEPLICCGSPMQDREASATSETKNDG